MTTKEREVNTMKIKQQVLNVHQFTATEWATLCDAENLVRKIYESYDNNIMLQCPNTGECIAIDELPRVLGILSFLTENRVVEVNPK
jgi:hypothetical protein